MTFSHAKDLLSIADLSHEEIQHLLVAAVGLKKNRLISDPKTLAGKTCVLIFEKPSLRTRISFETAIHELGGHPINLDPSMVQIGKRETVADVARNLERIVHCIIARTFYHTTIAELARHCSVPVINALSDEHHPCQALALALTIFERTGSFSGHTVVFIGDGNNVCNSLMALCAITGNNFVIASPHGYEPRKQMLDECLVLAQKSGSTISVNTSPKEAVAKATVVYTDVWASMGQENEAEKRKQDFKAFQVNTELMSHAPKHAFVSHCLPAHRGEEISSDVLDSENSIAFDEAENRLHIQKAVIAHLFS